MSPNPPVLFGDKEVRWYQLAIRNGMVAALKQQFTRILIEQPTGTGKTLSAAFSLGDHDIRIALGVLDDRPLRVLFASHKRILLDQAEETFLDAANVEVIQQSIFTDIPQDVLNDGWDVTILDECHHEACSSFQYLLEKLGDRPLIGMTATSDRPDGCLIKFQVILNPLSREQAVEEGWISETELNTYVDTPISDKTDITKRIIDEFGHEFGQTMMFFRTKAEVIRISDYLNSKGYVAVPIISMSEIKLKETLNDFSAGKFQFLVNCNKINEGVDAANCTDVYLGRQFGSYIQLNQVIGRAARPDSKCVVHELINPLSAKNLDATVIVGTPTIHRLRSKKLGNWVTQFFDYTNTQMSHSLWQSNFNQ